ncbi:hypothetical protein EON73_00730 [bacterium]|nr:MAG: hypothetical protein EON73_00730 [bacterium]
MFPKTKHKLCNVFGRPRTKLKQKVCKIFGKIDNFVLEATQAIQSLQSFACKNSVFASTSFVRLYFIRRLCLSFV